MGYIVMSQRRTLLSILLITLLWGGPTHATNRWDILKWCAEATSEDAAQCGGFLSAAIDLRTHDDFPGPKSCFLPDARLSDVRIEVVAWLKKNRVVAEQSGLALVARAIKERVPCPE